MLMGRDGALAPLGFEVPQGDYAWSKEEEEDNGRDVKVESADGELEVESDDGELETYFFIWAPLFNYVTFETIGCTLFLLNFLCLIY